ALGNAAALLVGLHAAARRATPFDAAAAGRYRRAAERLGRAIRLRLGGPDGYRHSTAGGGPDAAVTWLAPPFAPPDPAVRAAVAGAARQLASCAGVRVVPGRPWGAPYPLTPATASFFLSDAAA